eukprot:gene16594-biopygen9326
MDENASAGAIRHSGATPVGGDRRPVGAARPSWSPAQGTLGVVV